MFRDLIRALAALCLLTLYAALVFWPHYGLLRHPLAFLAVVAIQFLVAVLIVMKPAPRRRLLRGVGLGSLLGAAMAMAGCSTINTADAPALINALASAGCSGTLSNTVSASTASGLSAGAASFTHTFSGTCDPAKAVKASAGPPAT